MLQVLNSLQKEYKILFIGNFWKSWDNTTAFEVYIKESLENLGHKVFTIQREEQEDLPNEKIDFILIAQWNGYADDMVSKLKVVYDCPVIYWAFDYHWLNKDPCHMNLAKTADLFLSKEIEHKGEYEKMGANFHWLPEDFAPDFYQKYPEKINKKYDVVFTGSHLDWAEGRTELLKAIDDQFDLHVFTYTEDAWKQQGLKSVYPIITDDQYPKLMAETKINIGVDHVISSGYWSDRTARVMAAGGFIIQKYVPMMELIFRDNIIYGNTIPDFIEKIRYWLKRDTEREVKIVNSYSFAQAYLKCKHRCQQLITIYENSFI